MLTAYLFILLATFSINGGSELKCADSLRVTVEFDSIECDSGLLVATLDASPSCQNEVVKHGRFVYLSFSSNSLDSTKKNAADFGDLGSVNDRDVSGRVCYKWIRRKSAKVNLTYMAKVKISEDANGILIEKTKFSSGVYEFPFPGKVGCLK